MDRGYNTVYLYWSDFLITKIGNFPLLFKLSLIIISLCFIASCGGGGGGGDVEQEQHFIVTFDTRGGSTINTLKLTVGKKIGEFQKPTKSGATFIGWVAQEGSTTPIASEFIIRVDINLYALWGYNVHFDTRGGNFIDDRVVLEDSSVMSLPTPLQLGKVFLGWIDDPLSAIPNNGLVIDRDTALYAIWDDLYYRVTFDSLGGSSVAPKLVKHGDVISSLPTPAYAGKVFKGWSTVDGGSDPDFSDSSKVYSNTDLFAVWEDIVVIYVTVSFNTDGGDALSPLVVEKLSSLGDELPIPTNSADAAAIFVGWTTDVGSNTKNFFQNTAILNNLTIYAIWKVKVEFQNSGDLPMLPIYIFKGESLGDQLVIPQSGQLRFCGWSTIVNSTFPDFNKDTVVSNSAIVYGIWEANITFDSRGGTSFGDRYVLVGQRIGELPIPVNDVFIFKGWSSDSSGNVSNVHSMTVVRGDITIFALWEVRYKVSFETRSADHTVEPRYFYDDELLGELPVLTSDGRYFFGWSTKDDLAEVEPDIDEYHKVASSFTLYAIWADTRAVLSFDSGGGSIVKPVIVYDGEIRQSLPVPAKGSSVFLGWSTTDNSIVPDVDVGYIVTEDMALYAVWQKERYSVEFNLNSGTIGAEGVVLRFEDIAEGTTINDLFSI